MNAPLSCLERAAALLARRITDLEGRVQQGDESAWAEYRETVSALARVLDHVAPGRRGELLTTAEMARRLGVAPKTLLRHKKAGALRPALQRGKLIRWRGDEAAR